MSNDQRPRWQRWAERIQSIAQTGLAYSKDPYDIERFSALRELAAEMVSSHVAVPTKDVLMSWSTQTGYPTPKVDVRAILFRDDKVLLVQEARDKRWTPPGGWADLGHSPGEVAAKETFEEAGLEVRPVKLLAVFDKSRHGHPPEQHYTYKIFIRCEYVRGALRTSHETDDAAFFGADELPELSTPRITSEQLRLMFEHLRTPDRPADFD